MSAPHDRYVTKYIAARCAPINLDQTINYECPPGYRLHSMVPYHADMHGTSGYFVIFQRQEHST